MRFFGALFMASLLVGCVSTTETGGVAERDDDGDRRTDIIEASLAGTVQLFTEREGGGRRAGSAVVIAADPATDRAFIMTTAHLLKPVVTQSIYAARPLRGDRVPVEVLAMDLDADLALLSASELDLSAIEFQSSSVLGDGVWVVAFPWGRARTVVNGVVSQITWQTGLHDRVPISGPVRLIDASVSYGMSGGGVFDQATGGLTGIVRGYRTAELALSGSADSSLKLPIAGETTVIPSTEIGCFLDRNGYAYLLSERISLSSC